MNATTSESRSTESLDQATVREVLLGVRSDGRTSLSAPEAKRVCDAYGIAVPQEGLATSADDAVAHAEQIGYLAEDAFVMRTAFERVSCISTQEALNASLDLARSWALSRDELPVPPGTLGGRAAYERFAEQLLTVSPGILDLLSHFSIPVGARRRGDAAMCFEATGSSDLADCFAEQAVTLGSLQYAAILGDAATLVRGCRRLGELHDDLKAALGT